MLLDYLRNPFNVCETAHLSLSLTGKDKKWISKHDEPRSFWPRTLAPKKGTQLFRCTVCLTDRMISPHQCQRTLTTNLFFLWLMRIQLQNSIPCSYVNRNLHHFRPDNLNWLIWKRKKKYTSLAFVNSTELQIHVELKIGDYFEEDGFQVRNHWFGCHSLENQYTYIFLLNFDLLD